MSRRSASTKPLTIIVLGASGDLAQRKIFPALFALFSQDLLPAQVAFVGFARSAMDDATFRQHVSENLTCRYVPETHCAEAMKDFLSRCHYVSGQYDSTDAFLDLYQRLREIEPAGGTHRLFYLAIPPSIFLDVAHAIGNAGFVQCGETDPWSRVVIEKPFGRDRASSDILVKELGYVFTEPQTYRIDHYLGKEVIQNLLVLRFANLIFNPIWNRHFIRRVDIDWGEPLGVEGRGGYFDQYGIVRDVVQNHLMQILALVAMEPPVRMNASAIRNEKVRVLKAIPPLQSDDMVLGQYVAGQLDGKARPAYANDPTVADGSLTPTYAAARLMIDNDRWRDVPFVLRAGKALGHRRNTISITFAPMDGTMFCSPHTCPEPNRLVIRVQPEEAIMLRINSKVPGLSMRMEGRDLDLQYRAAFTEPIPDAYEDLLMDVINGDKTLFIRSDELAAAWDIFTPYLLETERNGHKPEPYAFGSDGPAAADRFFEKGT